MPNNAERLRRAALRQLHHQTWMKTRMGFEHCFARFEAAQVDLTPEFTPGHSSLAKG
jgi:hypothetical protein